MNGGVKMSVGVLVLATVVRAASAQPAVGSVLVAGRSTPGEVLHVFGGRTVTVPLIVHAWESQGVTVRGDLVQLTSSLAAPVARGIDVPLSGSTRSTPGPASGVDLSVSLPSVSRETDFELRFRSFHASEGTVQDAGLVVLRVYPADLLEPFRVWAGANTIQLKDTGGSLGEFLRGRRIPVAAHAGPSDLTLYAGPRPPHTPALPGSGDRAAIYFSEREAAGPRLVVERTGHGTTVEIEMRLLDRLATDPLAQKMFLDAFQRAVITDDAAATQGVVR
jgi:hypothetical protein